MASHFWPRPLRLLRTAVFAFSVLMIIGWFLYRQDVLNRFEGRIDKADVEVEQITRKLQAGDPEAANVLAMPLTKKDPPLLR